MIFSFYRSFKAGKSKALAGLPSASGETAKVDAATSNIEKLLKWIQKRVNQYPVRMIFILKQCNLYEVDMI